MQPILWRTCVLGNKIILKDSGMERVFITGRGIVSPIGDNLEENLNSLRSGRSGTVFSPEFDEHGLDSKVCGLPNMAIDCGDLLDRKKKRFCPATGQMSIAAVRDMFAEAGLSLEEVRGKRIALIGGQAGTNYPIMYDSACAYEAAGRKLRAITPYIVPLVMPSASVSNVSLIFGLKGESYDISAACASSGLAIILGTRMIRAGLYDMVVAGGAEQVDWIGGLGFGACRALSTHFNDRPGCASRPFDQDRDGFVLGGGAAYVLLESERSVKARGVRPITEVRGIASNSNATDMLVPDAPTSAAVMAEALADSGLKPSDIGYVNTHGTSTVLGDALELGAIREVLGTTPAINSTKSQTGHMIGASGAAEAIFTSLMMEHNFISRSINIENVDPKCAGSDLVRELREGTNVKHALSNSFAFGGSNVALILSKC